MEPASALLRVVVATVKPGATVMESGLVAVWLVASVTSTVKFETPFAAAVPLMRPEEERLSPAGSAPLRTDQV